MKDHIRKFHEDHNRENKERDEEFISTYQLTVKDATSSLSVHKSFSQLSDPQSCLDAIPLENNELSEAEKQLVKNGTIFCFDCNYL